MRALSSGALALALTGMASLTHAEVRAGDSAMVWLDWSSGPGTEACIPPRDVVVEVEHLLGRRVFAAQAEADRTLHVEVTHDADRYGAQMILLSKAGTSLGTREIVLETSACQDASDAFVLAISMLADLPRTSEETARPSPPPPRPPPRAWHLRARLGPALAIGTAGDLAPGGHLSAMLSPPTFWPLGLDALSTVQGSSPSETTRYVLSSTSVAATVCLPPYRARKLEVTGCLGPQATLHVGTGSGFAIDRTDVQATFGGVIQAYGLFAITSAVHLFGMLALSATPQQVDVVFLDPAGNPRDVHLTSSATASAAVGISLDIF